MDGRRLHLNLTKLMGQKDTHSFVTCPPCETSILRLISHRCHTTSCSLAGLIGREGEKSFTEVLQGAKFGSFSRVPCIGAPRGAPCCLVQLARFVGGLMNDAGLHGGPPDLAEARRLDGRTNVKGRPGQTAKIGAGSTFCSSSIQMWTPTSGCSTT